MIEKVLTIEELKKPEYIPYLSRIAEITHDINIPYEYIVNNKKYVICSLENELVLASIDNDIIDLYTITIDDNYKIAVFSKNEQAYLLREENDYYAVEKMNVYTNKIDVIKYGNILGKDKGLFVLYSQQYANNNKYLDMQYEATDFNDDNFHLYLRYMKNHLPYLIMKKDFLLKKYYKAVIVDSKEKYSPMLMLLNNPLFVDSLIQEPLESIVDDDYNLKIPDDLIELATHTNKDYNVLKEITNQYQKILKR